jgi:hypothetical protein
MIWFGDYTRNDTECVRYPLDSGEVQHPPVVKHYMLSPDKGDSYLSDVRSYADLQRLSEQTSGICGEKPVYHVREEIPWVLKPMVDPHPSYTKHDQWFWRQPSWSHYGGDYPGYYVRSMPKGYVEVYFQQDFDGYKFTSTAECHGSYSVWVKDGSSYAIAIISISYWHYRHGWFPSETRPTLKADWIWEFAQTAYDAMAPYFASVKTADDIRDMWEYSSGLINLWSASDLHGRYSPYRSADLVNEEDLFDPREDAKLVAASHKEPPGLRANLVAKALADTSFNTNSIANLLDLYDWAVKLKNGDFGSLLLDLKRGGKVAADAWLKYRYVYSTTKSDIAELGRYASVGTPTICRAGEQTDGGKMQVKVALTPKSNLLGPLVDRLTRVGLAPNAYNLWDLVPFSFVVDWFVDLGSLLEELTQYGRVAAYDIKYTTISWRYTDFVTRSLTRASIEVYNRQVSPTAPPFVPYISGRSATDETLLKRCADSVALISR